MSEPWFLNMEYHFYYTLLTYQDTKLTPGQISSPPERSAQIVSFTHTEWVLVHTHRLTVRLTLLACLCVPFHNKG